MAKLSNTTKGDLGLPNAGIIVPANGSVDNIDDAALDVDLENIVVKAWIKEGKLVLGDYVEPDEDDDNAAPDDGLDKMTKAQLVEEADKLDLEFDEAKVTKAQLIDLIRAADKPTE